MVAIDTCSLVALVRYYLPFDKNSTLFNFINNKIESKEIIVIDKVYEECQNVSQGIVVQTLPFLKSNQSKTSECLPNRAFFNNTNNQFINGSVRNKLTTEEFEALKNKFLESADAKLILWCIKNSDLMGQCRVVTEETEVSNDNKGFKKIPTLCKIMNIGTLTLPSLLDELDGIDCQFV
jgi:uncharacterized protein DUF4411